MNGIKQDIFISHASRDKSSYIMPLTEALAAYNVTFWLDDKEIGWGDNIVMKINDGLRKSQYGLICLSSHFLNCPWPEAEMSSILAMQNHDGKRRLLPLILNSKEIVLQQYPLLASLAYREYVSASSTASELAQFVGIENKDQEAAIVTIETAHAGKLCRVRIPPRVSIGWLIEMAISSLNLQKNFEISEFSRFHFRWILVDAAAERTWRKLSRRKQRMLHAIISSQNGEVFCQDIHDRIEIFEDFNGKVFHLYAIEDESFHPPRAILAC